MTDFRHDQGLVIYLFEASDDKVQVRGCPGRSLVISFYKGGRERFASVSSLLYVSLAL